MNRRSSKRLSKRKRAKDKAQQLLQQQQCPSNHSQVTIHVESDQSECALPKGGILRKSKYDSDESVLAPLYKKKRVSFATSLHSYSNPFEKSYTEKDASLQSAIFMSDKPVCLTASSKYFSEPIITTSIGTASNYFATTVHNQPLNGSFGNRKSQQWHSPLLEQVISVIEEEAEKPTTSKAAAQIRELIDQLKLMAPKSNSFLAETHMDIAAAISASEIMVPEVRKAVEHFKANHSFECLFAPNNLDRLGPNIPDAIRLDPKKQLSPNSSYMQLNELNTNLIPETYLLPADCETSSVESFVQTTKLDATKSWAFGRDHVPLPSVSSSEENYLDERKIVTSQLSPNEMANRLSDMDLSPRASRLVIFEVGDPKPKQPFIADMSPSSSRLSLTELAMTQLQKSRPKKVNSYAKQWVETLKNVSPVSSCLDIFELGETDRPSTSSTVIDMGAKQTSQTNLAIGNVKEYIKKIESIAAQEHASDCTKNNSQNGAASGETHVATDNDVPPSSAVPCSGDYEPENDEISSRFQEILNLYDAFTKNLKTYESTKLLSVDQPDDTSLDHTNIQIEADESVHSQPCFAHIGTEISGINLLAPDLHVVDTACQTSQQELPTSKDDLTTISVYPTCSRTIRPPLRVGDYANDFSVETYLLEGGTDGSPKRVRFDAEMGLLIKTESMASATVFHGARINAGSALPSSPNTNSRPRASLMARFCHALKRVCNSICLCFQMNKDCLFCLGFFVAFVVSASFLTAFFYHTLTINPQLINQPHTFIDSDGEGNLGNSRDSSYTYL